MKTSRNRFPIRTASAPPSTSAGRVDLFKWCFLFWVGQVLAIGGMLEVMLRLTR